MLTKAQALTEDRFHENGSCRVWRRNGATQTWKSRPHEWRIPRTASTPKATAHTAGGPNGAVLSRPAAAQQAAAPGGYGHSPAPVEGAR